MNNETLTKQRVRLFAGGILVLALIMLLAPLTTAVPMIAGGIIIVLAIVLFILGGSDERTTAEIISTDFDTEKIKVTVPWQKRQVQIKKLDLVWPDGREDKAAVQTEPRALQPHRLVINFEIVERSNPDQLTLNFDPPLTLEVAYTADDWRHAEELKQPLTLFFWDGKKWSPFTDGKHQLKRIPDANGQTGKFIAYVKNWDDRQIGWGP